MPTFSNANDKTAITAISVKILFFLMKSIININNLFIKLLYRIIFICLIKYLDYYIKVYYWIFYATNYLIFSMKSRKKKNEEIQCSVCTLKTIDGFIPGINECPLFDITHLEHQLLDCFIQHPGHQSFRQHAATMDVADVLFFY